MADPSTAKVSYETVAIDSGYLSDLVEAVQRNNDDATAWFASSSNSGDADFTISTFEDTTWDVPARTKAKAAAIERNCRNFAAKVKKPTHFPIIPLASTLARARAERAEHSALHVNNSRCKPIGDKGPPQLRRTMREAVVDQCGRTRAASRRLTLASTAGADDSSEILKSSPKDAPRSKRQKAEYGDENFVSLGERN